MTLNDKQIEAINHKEGPCLVLAGAGSGKTRVLTQRIVKLINDGVSPYNILAITFTNKAAREMKSRVESEIGSVADSVFIGTFHSFGLRIIRENYMSLGLKSNITMDNDYSDEEVINALKSVGGEYLLTKSPEGINMPISFRGENLSLGEKQLISFARIILRNPRILVLDEATANIDSETETIIKNATYIVSKNRTTFIIAHRLSTVKECNRIIVLDHGNIVGIGKHNSLYKDCEIYRDMYDNQYKNMKN